MNKLIISICLILSGFTVWSQGETEISTIRIGPFKIFMSSTEASAIASKQLAIPTEKNEYNGTTIVRYNGDLIELNIGEDYTNDATAAATKYTIQSMVTQSSNFKTKSGMGVGSTREQLLNTYKNFSSFSVYSGWTDEGKRSKVETYFVLNDEDANTQIIFKMRNNVVEEITVSIVYEGC